ELSLLREVADVGSGAEGFAAGAGEDRALDAILGRYPLGRVVQLVHDLVIERVQLVGTVGGDERDGVACLEQEGVVAHGEEWYHENAEVGTRNAEQAGRPSC